MDKWKKCKYCKNQDKSKTEQPCVRCFRNTYFSDCWEAHPLTEELMEMERVTTMQSDDSEQKNIK